jgi:Cys-rich four helix bundle protein (predicted Tat secretion target)
MTASRLAFGAEKKKSATPGMTQTNQKAIEAALECVKTGEACISHCQMMLANGDKSMAECLKSALEMTAMCRALASLAAYESKSLKKAAAACAEICRNCEKTCEAHASKHAVCNDCMNSCKTCAAECEKLAA